MATSDPTSLILNEKDLQRVRHFVEVQEYICLLNIFSSRGFGKTTFLDMVRDSYRSKFPLSLVCVCDYFPEDKEGSFRLDDFLIQILSDLESFGSDQEKQTLNTNVELKSVYDFAARIIEWINIFSRNDRTTLIIIDDYDRLPYGSRVIFEDILLSKAIDQPRKTKVILSSGRELNFTDRLDLRVRLTTHALSALDEKDIARTISTKSNLAPTILKWSGGIPDLAEFLINRAKKKNVERHEVSSIRETELIDQDYRSHISKVMFPDVELLTEEVVDVLALLRRFDVAVLSTVLPKIEPKRFSSFKQKDYFDLIRELGDRVYWRDQGGYALNNVLQVMLSSYIRGFDPLLYEKVNKITAKTYEEWLKEEFRIHYLTEMLYHEIQIRKLREEDNDSIIDFVSTKILGFIEGREQTSPEQLDGLDEIKHILVEDSKVRPYIKQEVFKVLEMHLEQ
jgi:hypothetical protein